MLLLERKYQKNHEDTINQLPNSSSSTETETTHSLLLFDASKRRPLFLLAGNLRFMLRIIATNGNPRFILVSGHLDKYIIPLRSLQVAIAAHDLCVLGFKVSWENT